MYINEVTLENFRGLKKIELKFDEKINLLVGINGVGKSSVLEAIGIMLSTFTNRVKGTPGNTKKLTNDDIRSGSSELNAALYMQFQGEPLSWSVTRYSKGHGSGKNQTSELVSLNNLLKPLRLKLKEEEKKEDYKTSVPLVAYYSVNRLFRGKSKPDTINIQKINYAPLEAYERSVSIDGVYFNSLSNWFSYRQQFLNKKYNEDSTINDPQLNAIEKAISAFLPEFSKISYDEKLEELVIYKNHEAIKLRQLSDGELCLIALVADIARRLAIANQNPSFNPLHGEAIILVDEIDLHLHPGWQRKLVDNFRRTFPKTQFVFSTHSPQMIGHVEPRHIWLFRRIEDEVIAYRPEKSLGMDSNSILEQLLDVDEREPNTKQELEKLAHYIENNIVDEAIVLLARLTSKCGDIDELRRARAIIKRKALLGRED